MAETSTKPYMLRALHEWCTDNGYTPQIVVQVDANTLVPLAHVRDGQITLNIGALATNRLVIGNEAIEFQARFNGVTEHLYVPINTVSAIYARETGAGMGFEVESSSTTTNTVIDTTPPDAMESVDSPASESPRPTDSKRPRLSIVK
jgi:stringent starvation protein B